MSTSGTPEQIRADIEATRRELSDTVDELAERLDVKTQATRKVHQARHGVRQKASRAYAAAPEPVRRVADEVGAQAGPPLGRLLDAAHPYRRQLIAGVTGLLVLAIIARRRTQEDD